MVIAQVSLAFWYDNPEVQGLIPGDCSEFLVFEVSMSNRPIFRADQGSAIENQDKRLFWPPEGRKVRQSMAENLQRAISQFVRCQILRHYCPTMLMK